MRVYLKIVAKHDEKIEKYKLFISIEFSKR
jgi:hypothetical protein